MIDTTADNILNLFYFIFLAYSNVHQAKPNDALRVAQFLNDDIAATCAKYPKRFLGIGSVPLQEPSLAAEELKRCMCTLKLAGVQIGKYIYSDNRSTGHCSTTS